MWPVKSWPTCMSPRYEPLIADFIAQLAVMRTRCWCGQLMVFFPFHMYKQMDKTSDHFDQLGSPIVQRNLQWVLVPRRHSSWFQRRNHVYFRRKLSVIIFSIQFLTQVMSVFFRSLCVHLWHWMRGSEIGTMYIRQSDLKNTTTYRYIWARRWTFWKWCGDRRCWIIRLSFTHLRYSCTFVQNTLVRVVHSRNFTHSGLIVINRSGN